MSNEEQRLKIVCAALSGLMSNPAYIQNKDQRIGYDTIKFTRGDAKELWEIADKIIESKPN
jgi:hypothetical protein